MQIGSAPTRRDKKIGSGLRKGVGNPSTSLTRTHSKSPPIVQGDSTLPMVGKVLAAKLGRRLKVRLVGVIHCTARYQAPQLPPQAPHLPLATFRLSRLCRMPNNIIRGEYVQDWHFQLCAKIAITHCPISRGSQYFMPTLNKTVQTQICISSLPASGDLDKCVVWKA